MGLYSRIRCTFLMGVWCISRIYCYNIQRIERENRQPVNLEIDFYPNYETKKFLDSYSNTDSEETMFSNVRSSFEATKSPATNESTPLDSWSVVWYIASFGGLIVFFLIVSCSEWCCRRAIRNSQNNCDRNAATASTPAVADSPPPSYDQFAPPSYESICLGRNDSGGEKSEYDIYVVPVHALGTIMETRETEDAPPSYLSTNFVPAYPLSLEVNQQESRVT